MEIAQTNIGLLIIMCLLLHWSHAEKSSQRKDELIQDTVRKFLGVKSDERTPADGKAQSMPPRYMMNLYEKYRSGQTPMQGNTVRSILAMRDSIGDVDMLIFNLTGLKPTEQILQSKLYLLKRRKPKGGRKREHSAFRFNVGCLPNMTSKHRIDISLVRQKPEWHSYDISESVMSCRQNRKGKDSLLGLTLEIRRHKGSHRLISFKRLIKQNSQPFVLIFSEDSQNQTNSPTHTRHAGYDELGDLLRARANEEGFLPEGAYFPQTLGRNHRNRTRRSKNYKTLTVKKDSSLQNFNLSSLMLHSEDYLEQYLREVVESIDLNRTFRSDFAALLRFAIGKVLSTLYVNKHLIRVDAFKKFTNNKLYQEIDNFSKADLLHQRSNTTRNNTFQKVLQSSLLLGEHNNENQSEIRILRRSKKSIADTLIYSTEVKESNDSEPIKTVQVLDDDFIENHKLYLKSRQRNKKRKKQESHRKQKKKRRRNRKLPFWWTSHEGKFHAQDMKDMCRRKSLTVDFTQLGWDDWIISPKTFNAHYCEGSCSFPIIKHTETSNHAVVQSLVHAMRKDASFPTPCCVPSETSALTLLYFDEHGGLVLKNYPNMIVEKCGCR